MLSFLWVDIKLPLNWEWNHFWKHFTSTLTPEIRKKSPKWWMTQNRGGSDICVWSPARKKHLKLFSSGRWIWKWYLHVSEFGIQLIHLHLTAFESVQTYFSIAYRKSLILLRAQGSHGPQRFSGWKYLPHRGLAMLNVKRAICES